MDASSLTVEQVREFVVAAHSNLERARQLLAEQPELLNQAYEWQPGDTETALQAAAHMGQAPIAEFLLARGAPLDLCTAAMLGRTAAVESLLAADPALIEARGAHNIPLLAHAALSGDAALTRLLYERGAREGLGFALSNAAARGHLALVEWLLAHARPALDWRNFQGKTPLALADENGHGLVAALLRAHGAPAA